MANLMTPVSHSTGHSNEILLRKLLIGKGIDGVGMDRLLPLNLHLSVKVKENNENALPEQKIRGLGLILEGPE